VKEDEAKAANALLRAAVLEFRKPAWKVLERAAADKKPLPVPVIMLDEASGGAERTPGDQFQGGGPNVG
jgi:hypothetical protein